MHSTPTIDEKLALPSSNDPTAARCHGAEDENGQPICDGDDIRTVTATAPNGAAGEFVGDWCAECRMIAVHDGYAVTVIG